MNPAWWLLVPGAYLLGAVPWGLLIGRVFRGVDVRQYGSGKTGMTNVLRTVGVHGAALVVMTDVTKGLGPVLLAQHAAGSPPVAAATALAALAGHNWSVFIRFQGGRGILTGLGGLAPLAPPAALAAVVVGIPVIGITRYVSLGSVSGTLAAVATALGLGIWGSLPAPYVAYAAAGGALIVAQHRDNIRRLMRGQERRLGRPAERRKYTSRA